MSMFDIFGISGSAMSAQSKRLNLTASNLANADSVAGDAGSVYKARHPVFQAVIANEFNQTSVGVRTAAVVESQAEHEQRYEPDHPLANENGYVFASNVNSIEEMTNMISASRSYQNNVEVVDTAKNLMMRTLRLGEG